MKLRDVRTMSMLLASSGVILGQGMSLTAHAAEGDDAVSEVVITGSRIVRADYESNTPITTVSRDILENSGSISLESKLLQLPQFAGASTSQFSTGYFNSGAATLNLRNLGDNRNLVLLEGRRLQPSQSNLAIDINTIPSALVENVEVITGGASAVYGADAVSGVVNFKLKRNFQGAQIDAYYGMTERGDGEQTDLSAVLGGNFGEDKRGNGVLALSYSDRKADLEPRHRLPAGRLSRGRDRLVVGVPRERLLQAGRHERAFAGGAQHLLRPVWRAGGLRHAHHDARLQQRWLVAVQRDGPAPRPLRHRANHLQLHEPAVPALRRRHLHDAGSGRR